MLDTARRLRRAIRYREEQLHACCEQYDGLSGGDPDEHRRVAAAFLRAVRELDLQYKNDVTLALIAFRATIEQDED
jgi:hypothetical protein